MLINLWWLLPAFLFGLVAGVGSAWAHDDERLRKLEEDCARAMREHEALMVELRRQAGHRD